MVIYSKELIRVIGVLLWQDGQIVQTEKFRVTNKIHDKPIHAIEAIESTDLDELALINISKNPEMKAEFLKDIAHLTKILRIPITCGGFINSIEDCEAMLKVGADKLMLNTSIIDSTNFVQESVKRYGSSTIIASVDIVSHDNKPSNSSKVFNNKTNTSIPLTLSEWLKKVHELEVGEIFFNNIDHDGARVGYDLSALDYLVRESDLPIIAFGGVSEWDHLIQAINLGVSAVAFGNALHYIEMAPRKAKKFLQDSGVVVRL
jgi:cyclase